jgi:hypothetical protein
VKESKLFLALITPISIRSSYVLFELGGRWCTGLPMFPVMGRGATSSLLEGPLSGINALNLENRPEVLQLLENMGKKLDRNAFSVSSFDDEITAVHKAASKREIEIQPHQSIEVKANDPLDANDKRILHYIHEAHPEHPDESELSEKLEIRLRDVQYTIRKLAKHGLICEPPLTKQVWYVGQPNPDGYFVLDKGIEYIRANMTKCGQSCPDVVAV